MANILTLEHYPNLPAISIQLSALWLVLLPNCAYANYAQTKHEEFLGRWGSLYYDAVKNHFC